MKHTGITDGLGRTVIVEEAQSTFDAIYAPRGWVTATQTEADAYFGAPEPDDTLVTTAQLNAALAGFTPSSGSLLPTAVKTSSYTAAASDYVPVDTTSGNVTITLPTAPADKTQIGVKHVVRGGTNVVTIACGGSDVLNKAGGSATGTLTLLNQSATLQYKASTSVWYVVGGDLPLSQLDSRYQAAGSGGAAVDGDLSRFWRQLEDDATNTKIAVLGDSTSLDSNIYLTLRQQIVAGGMLAGMQSANVLDFSTNGAKLRAWLDNAATPGSNPTGIVHTHAALVTAAPHLIILSWLHNDVRDNTCDEATAKARLVELITLLQSTIPNADIVLRVPNPILSTNVGSLNYLTTITPAEMTRIEREAFLAQRGLYAHTAVWDSAPVYGMNVLALSPMMADQIHPSPLGYVETFLHMLRTVVAPPGRREPHLGPMGRYVRTGKVISVGTGFMDVGAVDYSNGWYPNDVEQNANYWHVSPLSTLYGPSGAYRVLTTATAGPTGLGPTNGSAGSPSLRITDSGFDFTTIAAAGDLVQLVGNHPGEGVQAGGWQAFTFAGGGVSIPANSSTSTTITVPGAVPGATGVIATPASTAGWPAGLIRDVYVSATDTVTVRVYNVTGSAITLFGTYWRYWLAR